MLTFTSSPIRAGAKYTTLATLAWHLQAATAVFNDERAGDGSTARRGTSLLPSALSRAAWRRRGGRARASWRRAAQRTIGRGHAAGGDAIVCVCAPPRVHRVQEFPSVQSWSVSRGAVPARHRTTVERHARTPRSHGAATATRAQCTRRPPPPPPTSKRPSRPRRAEPMQSREGSASGKKNGRKSLRSPCRAGRGLHPGKKTVENPCGAHAEPGGVRIQ